MKIGSLGDIIFEVSDDVIRSINKLEHSGAARISTHPLRLRKGMPEFTGVDPDQLSMTVRVAKVLGADPEEMIEKVERYTENGTILRLQIGKKTVGSYRWLLSKYKITYEDYDRTGNLVDASVNLTLIEYPNSKQKTDAQENTRARS